MVYVAAVQAITTSPTSMRRRKRRGICSVQTANHGNLPDQLDEGLGAMPQINLPHVLHTFDTSDTCDRGRRILNVATDLTAEPTAPGYDAEALDDLRRALGKLIDRRKGYDQIVLLHFSPVVA